jgi:hypothetical protein
MVVMLIWGLASSCISEDHSECSNRYWLRLSYFGDGTQDIFQEKIDQVNLYIFDKNSKCVYQGPLSATDIKAQSYLLPPLEEGKYTIVCLGNPYSTTVTGLSDGLWNQVLFAGNDPNYLARLEYEIGPYSMKKQEATATVAFDCSHYDISVRVEGATVTENLPSIVISGAMSHTDFTNTACGQPVDYNMTLVNDGAALVSSGNIFRHLNHQDVYLKVLAEDGSELAVVNFQEFITEHNIDCSKQEVCIPFKIVFKSASVEITLPGWDDFTVNPDFN